MIDRLVIKNFGFFTHAELDFKSGFTAITGETGAGKSTFLEAIKAVLGHKITKTLCAEADTTVLELVIKKSPLTRGDLEGFFENNTEIFLRLIIKNQGRPRYFINEEPVKQADVKTFTDSWFVLHAQHEISSLKKNSVTREWLDSYAHLKKDLLDYQSDWKHFQHLQKKLTDLSTDSRDNDLEYWQFLAEELAGETLDHAYVSSLEEKVQRATNQENITQTIGTITDIVDGSNGLMGQAETLQTSFEQLQKYGIDLQNSPVAPVALTEQIQDLQAFVTELGSEHGFMDEDPAELQQTYQRLLRLQEKHNVHSFTELAEIELTIQQKIGDIQQREKRLETLKNEITNTEKKLWQQAKKLQTVRQSSAKKLAMDLTQKVMPLGIPKARFEIDITERKILNQYGCSTVDWKFSANPGKSPEPLSTSASGGELSRVMLGLYQILSQQSESSVLFFDEIDTGISGTVLQKMAQQLCALGQNQQIITITHQGIMASQADQHWHIRKNQTDIATESRIDVLNTEGRAKVIAELMSGEKQQDQAAGLALEMLG
jgi:DNA repair protein RecN (Recombination protein N)